MHKRRNPDVRCRKHCQRDKDKNKAQSQRLESKWGAEMIQREIPWIKEHSHKRISLTYHSISLVYVWLHWRQIHTRLPDVRCRKLCQRDKLRHSHRGKKTNEELRWFTENYHESRSTHIVIGYHRLTIRSAWSMFDYIEDKIHTRLSDGLHIFYYWKKALFDLTPGIMLSPFPGVHVQLQWICNLYHP